MDDPTETAEAPKPKDASKSADKSKTKDAKGKGKGKAGKQKGKQAAVSDTSGSGLSIAAHPRAAHRVAQAKSWGGLIGFLLGGYLSLPTNTLAATGLHALLAGAVCYVVVWAGAVFLWRHLVVAELRSRQHEMLQSELQRLGFPTSPAGASGPVAGSRQAPGAARSGAARASVATDRTRTGAAS
jgi:hypothetical protein